MKIQLFIAILNLLLIIAVKLWHDLKYPIKHKTEWKIMAGWSIISIVCFTLASNLAWYYCAPLSGIMCAFYIWLLFDGLYNLFRGFKFWFTGSEDGPEDAKTDNFLQSIPLWLHITIKLGVTALTTFFYIKYFH